ncbi:thaumatin-like protein [Lentinus tigrinus ALCF2SS1-7]|uniref:Thaumatin-like protein n=1 Tax=Lentinus tigrinus ALCF2SS1-6 TaxID=1328759 RepID=A0A5C2SBJ9_9APHY|nr:thaumatin-like protein [Lentinus tigrinus ALCF2SS1-6]RPD75201.1 thaumatin-like protein [Lentinus tigrinus ALCF2SS1-7]
MMTSFIASTTVAVAVFAASAAARTMTVKNNCGYTIWPALFTDLNVSPSSPSHATGWEQGAHQTVSFDVPNDWRAGRIWGRRGCDFSKGPAGPNQCLDGGCNGGLECDPHTGTGVPPATVAEFTFAFNGQPDNYDVSLVDGFNMPMSITNNKNCHSASCPADLNFNCPSQLTGPKDSSGQVVGCLSACAAGLGGDPQNNKDCCTGSHGTAATCPPSDVDFYQYFKGPCPDSYAYAYDEQSHTALWTCDGNLAADYTVTFCP